MSKLTIYMSYFADTRHWKRILYLVSTSCAQLGIHFYTFRRTKACFINHIAISLTILTPRNFWSAAKSKDSNRKFSYFWYSGPKIRASKRWVKLLQLPIQEVLIQSNEYSAHRREKNSEKVKQDLEMMGKLSDNNTLQQHYPFLVVNAYNFFPFNCVLAFKFLS